MNRSLYSFAIFLAVLYTIASLCQSLIYLQLGTQIFSLESFATWYACTFAISFLGTLTLLKYFHHKKYTITFWTAMVAAISSLLQFIVIYGWLNGVRAMAIYYMPAGLLFLVTEIIFSLTCVFSAASKRPWLKAGGIFTTVIGLVILIVVIWGIDPSITLQKKLVIEKIYQWTSLVGSVAPLFMVMNFLDELKLLKKEDVNNPQPSQGFSETAFVGIGMLLLTATFILASRITSETNGKLSWEKQLAVNAVQWRRQFETRTYKSLKGDLLSYQLLMPLDYDSAKKYPMVVGLPFVGGVEGCPPAEMLVSDFNRKKYPSFLFVPFCPEGAGWGGIPNYPTIDTLVFESIGALAKEFKTLDEKRIYVTGVSRSGYGSWHFISSRPDMFAAAIPVCGGGDTTLAKNIVDVDVWAFHGENDNNVPVERSRNMITAIRKAGGNPKYTEFPNASHNIWDMVSATPGLLDWLFEQKRD
jgi:hypothetical protein